METFGNQIMPKLCFKFYCKNCDYGTSKKSSFESHKSSSKHQKTAKVNVLETNYAKLCQNYSCEYCQKEFKNRSGLWKHKKKCENEPKNNSNKDELIQYLMKESQELKNLILEIAKKDTYNHSINNSHNKTFNLQLFLNETCKDAMNITEFVDSLQLQLSDLEKVGEVGYIEGISSIIVKNLNALDVTERPIHCTDKKRETMYVKDENKWERENEQKDKMHKMIKKVSNKNINLITEFREKYTDYKKCNSKVSDQFNKIIIESMGGHGDNDYEKEEKIIKKIAKEVFVEKSV
jgi:hypothetical protein